MGIIDKLIHNVFSKDMVGYSAEVKPGNDKLPIYPGWFYTAPFGQPRSINVLEVRNFSKSPWIQMVTNTIKKELSIVDWDIVPVDEKDKTDYSADIQKVKDFLNNINSDKEDIDDVITPMIDDVLKIDAGAWVKVYTLDSYQLGQVPVYNGSGDIIGYNQGMVLKPLGQRTLKEIRYADGSTMLRQVDIYRRTLAWYQYSFKNPRTNPKKFYPEEVVYFMMNKQTDSVYGFSPVQSVQQVLELLIQATRWNKDYFKNNAIPDGIVSLPNANPDSMARFKESWMQQFKGKNHKILFQNTDAKFTQFMTSARDMEWLTGQKWYFHLVFAVYGMSPTEVGFHENVNQGNQAGQERITVKNAIKPYFTLVEKNLYKNIITEILQQEKPKIKFKYMPKDHAEEQIEFDQNMKEIEIGTMTINEYRTAKGRKPVEGGDEIKPKPQNANLPPNPQQPDKDAQKPTFPEKPNKKEHKCNCSDTDCGKDNHDDINKTNTPSETNQQQAQQETLSKSTDPEIVDEAKDYEDFFIKTVDMWKAKTINSLKYIEMNKEFNPDEFNKTFGQFIQNMFNSINTKPFLKNIARFIKGSMMEGLNTAEEEMGVQVGWTNMFDTKLTALQDQQLTGYTINGEKWHGIRGATAELRLDILKTVEEDVKNKVSKDDMVKHIQEIFDGATVSQAKRIANTETNRFVNESKLTAYKQSGIKGRKAWSIVPKNCCDTCTRLHKKYGDKGIPFDEPFYDDITGKSGQIPTQLSHPNCRCVIEYRSINKN